MTDDDFKLDAEWPLLRDAIRFVLEVTKSTSNTRELLFHYLARGANPVALLAHPRPWGRFRRGLSGGSTGVDVEKGRENFRKASFAIDVENSTASREGMAFDIPH